VVEHLAAGKNHGPEEAPPAPHPGTLP